ncbi:MAG: hypothetical protein AAFO80_12510 [Pseudomonadota bacterium]
MRKHDAVKAVIQEALELLPDQSAKEASRFMGSEFDIPLMYAVAGSKRNSGDATRLRELRAALKLVEESIRGISPWARSAIDRRIEKERPEFGLRHFTERMLNDAETLREQIKAVERQCATKPFKGQVNWHAVAVVDIAQECWCRHGKTTPKKVLNDANPFKNFLEDLFEALDVKGTGENDRPSARSAYRAWLKKHS